MIEFSGAVIDDSIIHFIGNRVNGEEIKLSEDSLEITNNDFGQEFLKFNIKPFERKEGLCQFIHSSGDVELNELYSYASSIFDGKNFETNSRKIAKHLYQSINHHKINSGEIIISKIKNIVVNDQKTDGIIIIKVDSKDVLFKIQNRGNSFAVKQEIGISKNNIEKACIIVNLYKEDGFRISLIDTSNSLGEEATYWRELFLQVREVSDNFHLTTSYLKICKNFIAEKLIDDFSVSKTDQIDYLNKSINYFKETDEFSQNTFLNSVFEDNKLRKKLFLDYIDEENTGNSELSDSFPISTIAVKQQSKIFKSVLKLDKNFHVYVHGNNSLIENGFDEEKGMKYYKLYYKEEN